MRTKKLELLIPARKNAPETYLRPLLVYHSAKTLKTLPYVFMLPGGPGANHSNYNAYRCLHQVANLVFFNPRGCGFSDVSVPSTYTMENYIEDVHAIKLALNLDSVILLGKSYGAMCALAYTLRYPKDVQQLILAAGADAYHFLQTAKDNLLARGSQEQQQICEYLWAGRFKSVEHVGEYFKLMAPLYSWKVRHKLVSKRPKPRYPFSYHSLNEGFAHQLWKFDYTKQLHQILCPTLILVGEEDWVTDPLYSRRMAELIPNAELQVFKNADHLLEIDVPELYFQRILDFLGMPVAYVPGSSRHPGNG